MIQNMKVLRQKFVLNVMASKKPSSNEGLIFSSKSSLVTAVPPGDCRIILLTQRCVP